MIPLIQSVCSTSVMYIELVYRFGKRNSMPMMLSVTEYTHPLCAVFWYSCHIQNIKRVKIILLFLILFIRDAYVKRRVFTLIFKRILYSMSSLLNRRRNRRYIETFNWTMNILNIFWSSSIVSSKRITMVMYSSFKSCN